MIKSSEILVSGIEIVDMLVSTYFYSFNWHALTVQPQALWDTLWFSLFSLKLNIFPYSASILTFSMQNHLILKYFTNLIQPICSTKYFKIRWFCAEKVKIEALKGNIFNFNDNSENHKVYPSACECNSKCTIRFRTKIFF